MPGGGSEQARTLGFWGAAGVGVGAIVGGGIFVLAGTAFANTGPSAMLAFAVNGTVALLTAMSFAEISSAFPQSGGAYTFAKKVLSVRSAFAVGWILWFAYIVAGVLYALGFASFGALAIRKLWAATGGIPPDWLMGRRILLLLATLATAGYSALLVRKSAGGGQWATVGKLVVFAVLILAGVVALLRSDMAETTRPLNPFFAGGIPGLLLAMGFTFIALQGFDLIAAVAGEVKDPGRNIPRAMFASLGCAMAVYLPLLFLVSTVGVDSNGTIASAAARHPENVIPAAAERFMGPAGYWLVLVAAILSTLSALHANILAASRVALSMAQDRTLPVVLGDVHKHRRTPVMAIFVTSLTLVTIVFMVPNLAGAGAAASLIFLISFTLAHVMTLLARRRGGTEHAAYRTPWFPVIPVLGGIACGGLAVFQAAAVPDSAGIVAIWFGLGLVLYWSLFARRAELVDSAKLAADPALTSLRGQSPLVLVPIANPAHTPALVAVANALAAPRVGRVLLLTIVPVRDDEQLGMVPPQLSDTQKIVYDALAQSYAGGHMPEALITAASEPLAEIIRIADEHHCERLVLGIGELTADGAPEIETLLNDVDCDVALMRAVPSWRLDQASRILVPVRGRGDQHWLRAQLLGGICRAKPREVVFFTVLPTAASIAEERELRRDIKRLANLKVRGDSHVELVRSDDPADRLVTEAADYDLVVLGLESIGWRRKVFGEFSLRVVRDLPCATILLSRRRHRALELLDPLRNDVVETIRGVVRSAKV